MIRESRPAKLALAESQDYLSVEEPPFKNMLGIDEPVGAIMTPIVDDFNLDQLQAPFSLEQFQLDSNSHSTYPQSLQAVAHEPHHSVDMSHASIMGPTPHDHQDKLLSGLQSTWFEFEELFTPDFDFSSNSPGSDEFMEIVSQEFEFNDSQGESREQHQYKNLSQYPGQSQSQNQHQYQSLYHDQYQDGNTHYYEHQHDYHHKLPNQEPPHQPHQATLMEPLLELHQEPREGLTQSQNPYWRMFPSLQTQLPLKHFPSSAAESNNVEVAFPSLTSPTGLGAPATQANNPVVMVSPEETEKRENTLKERMKNVKLSDFQSKFITNSHFRQSKHMVQKNSKKCTSCDHNFTNVGRYAFHYHDHGERRNKKGEKREFCPEPDCPMAVVGFCTRQSVLRHIKSIHENSKVECSRCARVFSRRDGLTRHFESKACLEASQNLKVKKKKKSTMDYFERNLIMPL